MKLKTVVFLMFLSLFCSFANADEVSHRAAAEELLLLTNADKMLKPMEIWGHPQIIIFADRLVETNILRTSRRFPCALKHRICEFGDIQKFFCLLTS